MTTPPLEIHPWQPFTPANARILIMGTFPPQEKRWAMDFFYPNRTNDFWKIMGLIFYSDQYKFYSPETKEYDLDGIKNLLIEKGIALGDTGYRIRRLKDNTSDKYLEIAEPINLRAILARMPLCRTLATTGEKAAGVLAEITGTDVPKIGSFSISADGMHIWRMPSTSRAYPLAIEKKAEYYRLMFSQTGIL